MRDWPWTTRAREATCWRVLVEQSELLQITGGHTT